MKRELTCSKKSQKHELSKDRVYQKKQSVDCFSDQERPFDFDVFLVRDIYHLIV